MHRIRRSFLTLAMTLAAGGTCLQLGGCDVLGLSTSVIRSINPCGTILQCDPRVWNFATSGIDGPGVRPGLDPYCVNPPFCTSTEDPIFGGVSGTP